MMAQRRMEMQNREEQRRQDIISANGYNSETREALRVIVRDIPANASVRPEYDGDAIRIDNRTYSQWRGMANKIQSAGFEVREDSDYIGSGNNGTGTIWINRRRR